MEITLEIVLNKNTFIQIPMFFGKEKERNKHIFYAFTWLDIITNVLYRV